MEPFDALGAQDDDYSQPEPDEHLVLNPGCGSAWLVKIPNFLMERWSTFDIDGVNLAKIRIYMPESETPRIVLFVPPEDGSGSDEDGDTYELDIIKEKVGNQIVVAGRAKDPSGMGRAHTTMVTGQIKLECNLRPHMTEGYRRRLMERGAAAKENSKRVRMIDGLWAGRGGISSSIGSGPGFAIARANNKPAKGQYERMTRMPRNQLLDALFALFRERERWPIKLLRERTQQPETYLKEVLSEIARFHRSEVLIGTWELIPSFKWDGIKVEGSQPSNEDASMDGYDEVDDEDDMEVVL